VFRSTLLKFLAPVADKKIWKENAIFGTYARQRGMGTASVDFAPL
jgi:hypothetical protein